MAFTVSPQPAGAAYVHVFVSGVTVPRRSTCAQPFVPVPLSPGP